MTVANNSEPPQFGTSKIPAQIEGPHNSLGRVWSIARYLRDPVRLQFAWAKQFPQEPVVGAYYGDARITLAYGVEALRHLSTHQGEDGDWLRPESGPIQLPKNSKAQTAVRGISTTNGSEHIARRRAAMAATHGEKVLTNTGKAFAGVAEDLMTTIRQNKVIDIAGLAREFSLRNSLQTVFGIRDDAEARSRLSEIPKVIEGAASPLTVLLQKDWPGTPYRRWLRSAESLYDWGEATIVRKRTTDQDTSSVLSAIIAMREVDGTPAPIERLIGDAVTLYVVGHDSTSQQLAWVLFLLAAHPATQAKVREELLGKLAGRVPDLHDDLPELDAAINEAMRLLPATFVLNPRLARRDTQLTRSGGQTRTVPRGAMVLGAILATHYDPTLWTNPTTYDTSRWRGNFKPDPYAFLPFGQGPRRCVGDAIASQQIRIFTGCLLQKHWLRLTNTSYHYSTNIVQLRPANTINVMVQDSPPKHLETNMLVRGNIASDLVTSLQIQR